MNPKHERRSGLAWRRLPRRTLLAGTMSLFAVRTLGATPVTGMRIQVWKDPSCGCCNAWIDHLQDNGFTVAAYDEGNNGARHRLGLPRQYASCHTALVQGYVIEGHVPAADIQRLLRDKPHALGLAVPGMPVGSPGMDGPVYNGRRDPYDVLLVQQDGSASVFRSYR